MELDLLELIEILLQKNWMLFAKERLDLPNKYWISNGLLLFKSWLCVAEDPLLYTCLIREVYD
jgi:hypothetical protein